MLPIIHIINGRERINRVRQDATKNRRALRDGDDAFRLPNNIFIFLYRLNKRLAQQLIHILTPYLQPQTRRGLTVSTQVLTALRFCATGNYQRGIGEEHFSSVCQTSVHFIIKNVTTAMVNVIVPRLVQFPKTVEERNVTKHQFLQKFGFPVCVGAIDGTHIALLKPNMEIEFNFLNRKGISKLSLC